MEKQDQQTTSLLRTYEQQLQTMQTDKADMLNEIEEKAGQVVQLSEQVRLLEVSQSKTMKIEEYERVHQENEQLKTDVIEVRAAMLSYKNMCQVIADQAKNIKLIHERRKDEHENLLEALREMQAEGVTKERVGKLYFIIMLSRWQEASVNKKYEAVISEVQKLRSELMTSQSQCQLHEIEVAKKEQTIKELSDERFALKHKVAKAKGCYISKT